MKRWLSLLGVVVLAGLLVGGGCAGLGARIFSQVVNGRWDKQSLSMQAFRWCANGLPFVNDWDKLFSNKTYVVLLQNNRELRPTGGFMGSYVRLRFSDMGLIEMKVVDIYQPDGQLPGHVEPPIPVQEAFSQGWWRLRDANWDVDTASAAATVNWFLEQGGEPVDGIIGINLEWMRKWLAAVGGVRVVTYGEDVNESNLYALAQKYAEYGFKPGSTSKRDFLGAVGTSLWEKTKAAGMFSKLKLGLSVFKELKNGQMWVWMKEPELQKKILDKKWGGKLERGVGDYLYIVETNLGANKANCCIERRVTQEVGDTEKVTIDWQNTSQYENPVPPTFWGGNYGDYVRVVIPAEFKVQGVKVQDKDLIEAKSEEEMANSLRQGKNEVAYTVSEEGDFKVVGFWAVVPAGKELRAEVVYTSPLHPSPSLREGNFSEATNLRVNRQAGIESFPYKLVKNGKVIFEGNIDKQRDFSLR